jgi:hypothetical protein
VQLHSFLNSALDGVERLTSRPSRFTSSERTPTTHNPLIFFFYLCLCLPKCLFPSRLLPKTSYTRRFSVSLTCLAHISAFDLIPSNILGRAQIMKLLITWFSRSSCYLGPFRSNYFLTPYSRAPSAYFLPKFQIKASQRDGRRDMYTEFWWWTLKKETALET